MANRRRTFSALSAALLFVVTCTSAKTALACAAVQIQPSRFVWPLSGARDVPRNARLYVAYTFDPSGAKAPTNSPSLRQVGGDVVAVTVATEPGGVQPYGERHYLRPQAPLLANTTYELIDDWAFGGCSAPDAGVCVPAPVQLFSTFTTGDGIDEVPPVFTSQKVESQSSRDICNVSACCGPYDVAITTLTWSAPSDQSAVAYRVYSQGKVIEPLTTETELRVQTRCKEMSYQPSFLGLRSDFGVIEVRGIDLAGNETVLHATGSINASACSSKGGCVYGGASTSQGAGSSALALFAAIGLVLMRRKP